MKISFRFLLAVCFRVLLMLVADVGAETLVFPPFGHSYGIRKATPAKLFLFFGNKTAFDDPQGIAAVKMKARDDPATDKDDDELTVYGVNSGRCEIIYNTSMWGLSLFGSRGSGEGQFRGPIGIAADPDGNVYVADCGNNRIVHLFNPRKEVRWAGAFPDVQTASGVLASPRQVALDSKGQIYVSDYGHCRIVIFTPSGKLCRTIPASGAPFFENGPSALAVADGGEAWSNFPLQRCVYCADRDGKRLWQIDFDGNPVAVVDLPPGHAAGFAAVDYFHSLWVTDRGAHCVLKFDNSLRLLDIFGSRGKGKNQFEEPRGIAIWKRFGQTFIAEKNGAQYYWVGTDLKSSRLSDEGSGAWALTVNVTEYSFISLFSLSGRDTVWALPRTMVQPGGATVRLSQAAEKTAGLRKTWLKIEPTYSSYMYFSWVYPMSPSH